MSEKKYHIRLSVPLGQRDGTLILHESDGMVNGWLEVMNRKNALSGQLSDDGQLALSGAIQTLMSTVQYTATGTISGDDLLLNLETASGAYFPVSGKELKTNAEIL